MLEVVAGSAPNVGTVYEVVCDEGYEQTGGLPFLVCQSDGMGGGVYNGDASDLVCSRKFC